MQHYDSGNWLEASKVCADIDKSCNQLRLIGKPREFKYVSFYIEPRYKYRSEGMKVTYGDVIIFRNIKNDMYIHISDREPIKVR